MLQRTHTSSFVEPCLPSAADHPPSGPDWVHEIKHDGYRLMARRDPIAISARLLTRNGHDWASRYPLEAVQALMKSRLAARIEGRVWAGHQPTSRREHLGRLAAEVNRHRRGEQNACQRTGRGSGPTTALVRIARVLTRSDEAPPNTW